jgi:hypothetical protein
MNVLSVSVGLCSVNRTFIPEHDIQAMLTCKQSYHHVTRLLVQRTLLQSFFSFAQSMEVFSMICIEYV